MKKYSFPNPIKHNAASMVKKLSQGGNKSFGVEEWKIAAGADYCRKKMAFDETATLRFRPGVTVYF